MIRSFDLRVRGLLTVAMAEHFLAADAGRFLQRKLVQGMKALGAPLPTPPRLHVFVLPVLH